MVAFGLDGRRRELGAKLEPDWMELDVVDKLFE